MKTRCASYTLCWPPLTLLTTAVGVVLILAWS